MTPVATELCDEELTTLDAEDAGSEEDAPSEDEVELLAIELLCAALLDEIGVPDEDPPPPHATNEASASVAKPVFT